MRVHPSVLSCRQRVWHGLGSVWMAVPLLLALAVALALGTWYEARYGTPAVQRTVYRSSWFFLLRLFLAINLAVAALRRWPWRRHHAGFVMVHAGIISILTGGLLGAYGGVQGELVIPERDTGDRLQLEERLLIVHQPNPGVSQAFPTAFEARARQREPNAVFLMRSDDRTYRLLVDRYLPNAMTEETVVPAPDGGPAVRLEAGWGDRRQSVWLWARDPERFVATWGPLHLGFFEALTVEAQAGLTRPPAARSPAERGTLVLTFPWGPPHRIPVAEALGRATPLAGTPYAVTIQRYFPDLAITSEGVVNRSEEPRNPAVVYTIADDRTTDTQIAVARAPQFAEAHGITLRAPVRVTYEAPWVDPPLPPNLLGILRGPTGRLEGIVTDERAFLIQRQPIAVGQRLTHPRLGVTIQLAQVHERAAIHVSYRAGATNEVRQPVLRVQVSGGAGDATAVWLPEGTSRTVAVDDGHPLLLEYRRRQHPLPFAVTLLDFRKRTYPGTTTAASFESEVELTDPARGVTMRRLISMNNPLRYRGYTLFQASYSETPVETTVLSVRRDPGVPCVYAGFLTVIAGLITMFYWRPTR